MRNRVDRTVMLLLLSPAKTLDPTPRPDVAATQPDFLAEAETLVKRLRKFSAADLGALMDVSDKLAAENRDRFRRWSRPFTPENAVPAVLMFRGDVYEGLQADTFTPKQLAFAQERIRILSGLYGLLRPLDLIQPYRLEMGTRFPTGAAATLYEFWGDKLARAVNAAAAGRKPPVVVNLASNEYFKAVTAKRLDVRVVTPAFKEERGGKLKMVSFFAKRARGLMARYVVTNRITRPDGLLGFDLEGYRFDAAASTEDEPTFTRKQA